MLYLIPYPVIIPPALPVVVEERAGLNQMQPIHYVTTTTIPDDSRVLGIIGSEKSRGETDEGYAKDEYLIFALGDSEILVTDTNGDIKNGDLITTSPRAGYGQKQDDTIMRSYTVAKSLADVDWDDVPIDPAAGFKWKLIPATFL